MPCVHSHVYGCHTSIGGCEHADMTSVQAFFSLKSVCAQITSAAAAATVKITVVQSPSSNNHHPIVHVLSGGEKLPCASRGAPCMSSGATGGGRDVEGGSQMFAPAAGI